MGLLFVCGDSDLAYEAGILLWFALALTWVAAIAGLSGKSVDGSSAC